MIHDAPAHHSEPRRVRRSGTWMVPAAGGALAVMMMAAFLFGPTPPAPRRAASLGAASAPLPAAEAVVVPDDDWLEENFLLRADESGTATVHPQGELVLAAPGGDMEARVQNGELAVNATHDGGWRVRALRPGARGVLSIWSGGELYALRVRAESAAPPHRRLWLVPPPPAAAAAATASNDPDADSATRAMLDELISLEAQGPDGKGSGEYGTGELDGVGTRWRRALRHGNVCGAVVDITDRRAEPFFYEPMSLAVGLTGRGTPEILARSGEGMVLPGKTQPALVIWYDPLPPGTAANSEAARTPAAGQYVLRFHPWNLPWRELAALATPTPAPAATAVSPAPTPRSKHR